MTGPTLPIDAILPRVRRALSEGNVVITAEPGAGKTTRVPPVGLELCDGDIWVTEPRRLAAIGAARRVADERGEQVGATTGYRVRFDRRGGSTTRLWYVTEGMLLRRLQSDPFLEGLDIVVFDELHERGLSAELALAMVRRVQQQVREDLRIVLMSATLDAEPLAAFLEATHLSSTGRTFPVDIRWLPTDARPAEAVARGVRSIWRETDGDVLGFLPGVGDIERAIGLLEDLPVLPLHGSLPLKDQTIVLSPSNKRRVVLATNVAESSVTVPGVTAVVDCGFEKQLRHDLQTGLDRLETVPISRASADQRAGRAGRLAPGIAVRLWSSETHNARPPFTEPELQRTDLAGPVLQLLGWGEGDVTAFPWFEQPDERRLAQALALLGQLGLADDSGVTALGRDAAGLPVHPRLARALLEAERYGVVELVARCCALLDERDVIDAPRPAPVVGPSDLEHRLDAIDRGRAHRGRAARVDKTAKQLARLVGGTSTHDPEAARRCLVAALPDRVCRRRATGSDRAVMVGRRGVVLDASSIVQQAELFVALEVEGSGRDARVRLASAVDEDWLETHERTRVTLEEGRAVAWRERCYQDLVLERHRGRVHPGAPKLVQALTAEAGRSAAVKAAAETSLMQRGAFLVAHGEDLTLPSIDEALAIATSGARSLEEIEQQIGPARDALLPWGAKATIERLAPESIEVPSGRAVRLQYPDDPAQPPVLAVKIQEMFGLRQTPTVAGGRVRVMLHLLAPNGRPQQLTDDITGFWERTWPQVRKELRGRYPKHPWPEDPLSAEPTARTRRRR